MRRRKARLVRGVPERTSAKQRLILVVAPTGSEPIELRTGSSRLPSGSEVVVDGERLHLRSNGSGATLNDVEVHGPASLNPGDLFREGEFEYLVLPGATPRQQRPSAVLEHTAWRNRVDEEVAVEANAFTVMLGRSGAFDAAFLSERAYELGPLSADRTILGTFGKHSVEVLAVGNPAHADAVRQLISDRAAKQDETVRWGMASFPAHGATTDELWATAAEQMLGLNIAESKEPIWRDPYMTRLGALAERWAGRKALLLLGSEGVGRETVARVIRRVRQAKAPFISHSNPRFDRAQWTEDVARAAGGALHVRRPFMLPQQELRAFWSASSFQPSAGIDQGVELSGLPPDRIVIPDLCDRPMDVLPIAEKTLHLVDAQLSRRRSMLRPEARALLQQAQTPENVRTLRNVVIRAALGKTGTEVTLEQFDVPDATPIELSIRAKVRQTERREIEAALVGSGWNVTEAARRMELPRRTLVYKIRRYGLRRPGRAE